jgi:hypothetical protein
MQKLKMDLEELVVESFETAEEQESERGSVHAHYGANHTETTCMQIICDCSMGPTDCDHTCPGYWNAKNATCWEC